MEGEGESSPPEQAASPGAPDGGSKQKLPRKFLSDVRRLIRWPRLPPDEELARFVRRWLPWGGLLAIAAAAVVMAYQLWPHRLTPPKNPNYLDNVFDSRFMVWLSRMLLVVAAIYLVGSVTALIAQNRWLSDFGPFRSSETFSKLEERLKPVADDMADLIKTNEELAARLEERDAEVKDLTAKLEDAKKGPPEAPQE